MPTLIVATKADKVTRNQLPHQKKILAEALGVKSSEILPFSSLAKTGKEELWKAIEEAAGITKAAPKEDEGADSGRPLDTDNESM